MSGSVQQQLVTTAIVVGAAGYLVYKQLAPRLRKVEMTSFLPQEQGGKTDSQPQLAVVNFTSAQKASAEKLLGSWAGGVSLVSVSTVIYRTDDGVLESQMRDTVLSAFKELNKGKSSSPTPCLVEAYTVLVGGHDTSVFTSDQEVARTSAGKEMIIASQLALTTDGRTVQFFRSKIKGAVRKLEADEKVTIIEEAFVPYASSLCKSSLDISSVLGPFAEWGSTVRSESKHSGNKWTPKLATDWHRARTANGGSGGVNFFSPRWYAYLQLGHFIMYGSRAQQAKYEAGIKGILCKLPFPAAINNLFISESEAQAAKERLDSLSGRFTNTISIEVPSGAVASDLCEQLKAVRIKTTSLTGPTSTTVVASYCTQGTVMNATAALFEQGRIIRLMQHASSDGTVSTPIRSGKMEFKLVLQLPDSVAMKNRAEVAGAGETAASPPSFLMQEGSKIGICPVADAEAQHPRTMSPDQCYESSFVVSVKVPQAENPSDLAKKLKKTRFSVTVTELPNYEKGNDSIVGRRSVSPGRGTRTPTEETKQKDGSTTDSFVMVDSPVTNATKELHFQMLQRCHQVGFQTALTIQQELQSAVSKTVKDWFGDACPVTATFSNVQHGFVVFDSTTGQVNTPTFSPKIFNSHPSSTSEISEEKPDVEASAKSQAEEVASADRSPSQDRVWSRASSQPTHGRMLRYSETKQMEDVEATAKNQAEEVGVASDSVAKQAEDKFAATGAEVEEKQAEKKAESPTLTHPTHHQQLPSPRAGSQRGRSQSPPKETQWRLHYQVPKDAYGRYSQEKDRRRSQSPSGGPRSPRSPRTPRTPRTPGSSRGRCSAEQHGDGFAKQTEEEAAAVAAKKADEEAAAAEKVEATKKNAEGEAVEKEKQRGLEASQQRALEAAEVRKKKDAEEKEAKKRKEEEQRRVLAQRKEQRTQQEDVVRAEKAARASAQDGEKEARSGLKQKIEDGASSEQ